MRTILLILPALVLASCAHHVVRDPGAAESPLFSVRMTQSAFGGKQTVQSRTYFTLSETGMVTGYRFRRGERIDVFGSSVASAALLEKLQRIEFVPFDFKREVEACTELLAKEAERKGVPFALPMMLDGAEYEITFSYAGVSFHLTEWNPFYTIDSLAPHSESIRKLKAILDLFALEYGRAIFER